MFAWTMICNLDTSVPLPYPSSSSPPLYFAGWLIMSECFATELTSDTVQKSGAAMRGEARKSGKFRSSLRDCD